MDGHVCLGVDWIVHARQLHNSREIECIYAGRICNHKRQRFSVHASKPSPKRTGAINDEHNHLKDEETMWGGESRVNSESSQNANRSRV